MTSYYIDGLGVQGKYYIRSEFLYHVLKSGIEMDFFNVPYKDLIAIKFCSELFSENSTQLFISNLRNMVQVPRFQIA